ncbi:MAG: FAD:protein FMN transferase [Pseudomonadota bacterium]
MILAVSKRTLEASWKRGVSICLLPAFILSGCAGPTDGVNEFQLNGWTMGTAYSVKVPYLPESVTAEKLKSGIESVLNNVNGTMSTYITDSELSRFNHGESTDWFSASPELVKVVKEALNVSEISSGAFDVTIGPLVNLWGFGPEHRPETQPDQKLIDERLKYVGYRHISCREAPPAIRKDNPDVYVDLSAVAKGYGVDRVAEYLEAQGIENYLVEVGGELRVKGLNARKTKWRIAVEKPTPELRTIEAIIELTDQAVATSGDYRNYFESRGKRFSHTIDPRTGKPITHMLASVTVLSHTSMRADALATALIVLGPEQGFALAERERIPALFIVKGTKGFVEKRTATFPDYKQVKE